MLGMFTLLLFASVQAKNVIYVAADGGLANQGSFPEAKTVGALSLDNNHSPIMIPKHIILSQTELEPLQQFFQYTHISEEDRPPLIAVLEQALPDPDHFLLTQPIMTLGVAHYYQATPKIRLPLYTIHNIQDKTYSRAIIMIVDSNRIRDDALLADQKNESLIVELGMIKINSSVLPLRVMDDVENTQIPFGALLARAKIKIHHTNTHYFSILCNSTLANLLNCDKNKVLYGRTNTLVSDDNDQWIARVVEISTANSNVSDIPLLLEGTGF